jgi:predicted cobalt transporter CbtA
LTAFGQLTQSGLELWCPVDGSIFCSVGTFTIGVDVVVALGFWSIVKMVSSLLCSGASDSSTGMMWVSKQVISLLPASMLDANDLYLRKPNADCMIRMLFL